MKRLIKCSKELKTSVLLLFLTSIPLQAQEVYHAETEPAAVQLRTNTLYDLALCPNVGLEVQTNFGLAFQLDYIGAWWNRPSRNHFYSNYGLQTEIRYYFNSSKLQYPYNGHHLGGYYQMLTYDFEFGSKGYQSNSLEKSVGAGISYGYTKPLNRNFSLDFTIGLGVFTSHYQTYQPYGNIYLPTESGSAHFYGPTKLEVSLVRNLNRKKINNLKYF